MKRTLFEIGTKMGKCPKCENVLVVKQNFKNNRQFLVCSKWPKCNHSEDIPEAAIQEAIGSPRLPGF